MVIRVNQPPKGIRRLFFWRKAIKPVMTEKDEEATIKARNVVALTMKTPERVYAEIYPFEDVFNGIQLLITDQGIEKLEHFSILGKLDRDITIKHEAREDYRGRKNWEIIFGVYYNAGSTHYGNMGAELVDEIGLVFPNSATPYASDVRHNDRKIIWRTSQLPEPYQIREVIIEADRQVSEIMLDYQRAEAIRIVRGRKKR